MDRPFALDALAAFTCKYHILLCSCLIVRFSRDLESCQPLGFNPIFRLQLSIVTFFGTPCMTKSLSMRFYKESANFFADRELCILRLLVVRQSATAPLMKKESRRIHSSVNLLSRSGLHSRIFLCVRDVLIANETKVKFFWQHASMSTCDLQVILFPEDDTDPRLVPVEFHLDERKDRPGVFPSGWVQGEVERVLANGRATDLPSFLNCEYHMIAPRFSAGFFSRMF